MWAIDSRARSALAAAWLAFASVNTLLMYLFPGAETIPFHLVWASFAFIYGITDWPRAASWPVVAVIIVGTGVALVHHAAIGEIEWEECSEIVLMPLIVGLLVWHVDRANAARRRLGQLREAEQYRAAQRELATRFGSHEIRTRLTIARGLVDLIGDDDDSPDWLVRDCRLATAELDKATKITHNLMTFVRAEDATLPMIEADLDSIVEAVGLRWRSSAARDWAVRGQAGVQLCDPERFEAALDCLVENAVKFTDEGDRIVISASWRVRGARRSSWRSRTPAPASRPRTCTGSPSCSTPARPPAAGPGRGSAWPSCVPWPRRAAARSTWSVSPAVAPR